MTTCVYENLQLGETDKEQYQQTQVISSTTSGGDRDDPLQGTERQEAGAGEERKLGRGEGDKRPRDRPSDVSPAVGLPHNRRTFSHPGPAILV